MNSGDGLYDRFRKKKDKVLNKAKREIMGGLFVCFVMFWCRIHHSPSDSVSMSHFHFLSIFVSESTFFDIYFCAISALNMNIRIRQHEHLQSLQPPESRNIALRWMRGIHSQKRVKQCSSSIDLLYKDITVESEWVDIFCCFLKWTKLNGFWLWLE